MWVAVHAYVTFRATDPASEARVLLEESVVLMEVQAHQDVYDRLDELKEMLGPERAIYPGYGIRGVLGIRKIVSVLNLDGDCDRQPSDKSEMTYELYEFEDEAAVDEFVQGKRIHAHIEKHIRRH